jgi:K+-transporting ATPase KdpF subunit
VQVSGGRHFHPRTRCAVRHEPLADRGHRPPAELLVNLLYAFSGFVTLALLVYLVYALLKPEDF